MAKVLVTGGAGFIGSHLVHALLERGDTVRVLDNFSSGSLHNLNDVKKRVEIITGDLRNQSDLKRAVEGSELIFHEAAFISVPQSIEDPQACYEVNVQGTIDLLEAARKAGVQKVVLASSAAVYGSNSNFPLHEQLIPEALSPYAASKQFNESLAQLYTHSYHLPVAALRYFNVYGPRQSPNSDYAAVVPKFIQRLKDGKPPTVFGDGSQKRDFVYVGDIVRANLLAASLKQAAGQAFNVCSGKETSLLDLLAALYPLFSNAPQAEFAEARLGDVPRSLGDPNLAQKVLGFYAETSLQDGLRYCVEALQA
jgi:nucleoside-diphosphate-sugar epimerase